MSRPINANRFSVWVGPFSMSFSKIRNISREIEVEALNEGGVNEYVHILQKSYSSPHKLIFERGLCDSSILSDLTPLLVGKSLPLPGIINVNDAKGETVASYFFSDPTILKWELGDLDAMQNSVLIETLEVAHSGIRASVLGF